MHWMTCSMTIDQLKHAYTQMLLIRRFEEKSGQLYGMGLIGGFCHLYIGQEAVVVGVQSVAHPQDTVITSYRDHGHMIACGMNPKGVMAELTGREGGYSRGKGGSMHMFSKARNFMGGHGIVGAQVSLGTGLAFSHQYRNDGGVALIYFGDGAANQGQVYESFNMASLWKLPAVYIIEDNEYSMGTSVARHASSQDFVRRGEAFDIPGRIVDGMDFFAVQSAAEWAVGHARSGAGPALLHMKTYRYRGHSMSDPGRYRSREEVDAMRQERDPIDRLKGQLLDTYGVDALELQHIDKLIREQVQCAVDFAQHSPEPMPSELETDVLVA
jgi:pyruvate dehydrogenase E1 component alpha subunit